MKLHYLNIRNFRLHADTDISFPPEGILGILGDNEAGKSTILEAIAWCLFGAKATRGTLDGLRWFRAPARKVATVTLVFEIGGLVYKVTRTETDATVSLMGDVPQTVAKGTAAVNEYLPDLIKMTLKEFTSSFMVKQKDVARIPLMLPTERVAFIRSIMGMGKIDAALKACRKKKSALSTERDGMAAGLGERLPFEEAVKLASEYVTSAKARLETATAHSTECAERHDVAKANLAASATDAEAHALHLRQRDDATKDISSSRAEQERLEKKRKSIMVAVERLATDEPEVARLPALRREKDYMVAAKASITERDVLTTRVGELQEKAAYTESVIADAETQMGFHDHDAWAGAARDAVKAEDALDALRSRRNSEVAAFQATAAAHEADYDRDCDKMAALEELGVEGECPTCTRVLGDAYSVVVDNLRASSDESLRLAGSFRAQATAQREPSEEMEAAEVAEAAAITESERLDTIKGDYDRAEECVERETPALAEQRARYVEAREQLTALPTAAQYDAEEFASLERQIVRLVALEEQLAPDRALVAQEDETRDLMSTQVTLEIAAQARVESFNFALATLAFDEDAHAAMEAAHDAGLEAGRDAVAAMAAAAEGEKHTGATLLRAQASLAQYDERAVKLKEVSAAHLTHERAAARLADFRVAIATTLRPEMEELMSGFVQILTDGRHESVELSEEFDAILYENGVPVEVVSGGTEDIAALAMRLALSQMIAERAGHPLSLLILDEPFGSLDENRRGNVLTLIRRLKGVFAQVVVISHVAETRDAVDHVVELEFDEGAGRARVVSATYVGGAA